MITLEQLERSVPALKGFTARYRAEVQPVLAKHDRRLKSGWELIVLGVVVGFPGAVLVQFDLAFPAWLLTLGYVLAVAGFGFIVWGGTEVHASRKSAKVILAQSVCNLLGFTYRLQPQQTYTKWFHKIAVLPGHDTYRAEDEVSGSVDGIDFVFQEVYLTNAITTVGMDGTPRREYTTVFNGLIGMINSHKRFASTTVAVPRQGAWQRVVGETIPGQRARLESPQFEERYDVYTSDQVEARYLLTPAFMERVLALDTFFKGNMEFAFDNGRFLFAANQQSDWMELRNSAASLSDETYAAYIILDVALIYHLIDALKLNAKTKA